jgi:hypothetical protein
MEHRAKSLVCSVLFNKFHHRTNLTALLLSIFSSKKLTTHREFSKFVNLRGYLIPFQIFKCHSVQYDESIHAPD